ncbi:MAG: hypothetical protein R3F59_37020 [Myxococcota bacterium]
MFVTVPALLLALLPGCHRARSQAEAVATELCRWGQLERFTPSVLPPEVDLEVLVREADRRYATQEQTGSVSPDNPFLALHQKSGMVVDEPAKAMARALAEQSHCEVAATVDGDRATVHVTRTVGVPVADEAGVFLLLRELNALPSQEQRVALIEDRIRAAEAEGKVRTHEVDLVVEDRGGRWVANLGLPEARIADANAKLAELKEQIAFGQRSEQELAKLVVVSTAYFSPAKRRSAIPRVDITVRNDSDTTYTAVDFYGTLTSADRDHPWVEDELPHKIRGPFEPGDLEEWTIVSRLPLKWRTRAPDSAVVTVHPIRAYGRDGKLLYSIEGFEEAKAAAAVLEEEIARLQATYLAPGANG